MVSSQGASTKNGTSARCPLLNSVRGRCPEGVRGANDLLAVGSALKIAHVGADLVLHSSNSHAILGRIATDFSLNRVVLTGGSGCGRSMWGVLGVALSIQRLRLAMMASALHGTSSVTVCALHVLRKVDS